MDLGIRGKRALVTGCDHGLAKAIAVDLAKEGAFIAVTSSHQKILKQILGIIGGKKKGHYAIHSDLIQEGQARVIARQIDKNFGKLDIIINCLEDHQELQNPYCSVYDWRKIFRYNLEAVIEINNLFIPHMKKQGWGRIVNISAGASMEHAATVQYCSSKAALTAYTRCMGRILATESANVVMSAVLPGAILMEEGYWAKTGKRKPKEVGRFLSECCPLGRLGKPEEISPMVVLLCSQLATYCQGAIVPIDGGQARHYFQLERG